jgi:hypothetical protein
VSRGEKCAVCYQPPESWYLPKRDRLLMRGTHETTWLCRRCRSSPVNRAWVETPSFEVYGSIDAVLATDGPARPEVDRTPDPYATPLCIEIMRRHVAGESMRHISKIVPCALRYVFETVSYWREHRGWFLDLLTVEVPSGSVGGEGK